MSLLSSFKKRSTLDAAIKQVALARKSEPAKAEQLYRGAYQGFASVIADHLIVSEALYHWGFALLHEALSQEAPQAIATYEDAISKFSFCLLMAPNYLGAAIDGGVAFMELARLSPEEAKPELYHLAEDFFEKACGIQRGSAAYNLACIYALANDEERCLAALQSAKEHGSLPDEANILKDEDMLSVVETAWFKDFIAELHAQPQPTEQEAADSVTYDPEPRFKLEKKEDFDYYS